MISNLMFVVGVAALSAGLRSFRHPILFRLGTLGVVVTSFLAGWLLGESLILGLLLAVSWFFLPWLEILTKVRHLRLPLERTLEPRVPPGRNTFPDFFEITNQIEEHTFEQVEDMGWDHEDQRNFYRIFTTPEHNLQAGICLVEQSEMAFYYLTLTSRAKDGQVYVTWNYPFSYGLKLQPSVQMNRFPGERPFAEMLAAHEKFLREQGVDPASCLKQTAEETAATMQQEMRAQLVHNLDAGLLKRDGEHLIRYTVRGMFYLWFQFLRDLVRLS